MQFCTFWLNTLFCQGHKILSWKGEIHTLQIADPGTWNTSFYFEKWACGGIRSKSSMIAVYSMSHVPYTYVRPQNLKRSLFYSLICLFLDVEVVGDPDYSHQRDQGMYAFWNLNSRFYDKINLYFNLANYACHSEVTRFIRSQCLSHPLIINFFINSQTSSP